MLAPPAPLTVAGVVDTFRKIAQVRLAATAVAATETANAIAARAQLHARYTRVRLKGGTPSAGLLCCASIGGCCAPGPQTTGNKSTDQKRQLIRKLLAAAKDSEPGYVVRSLQVGPRGDAHVGRRRV
jgi:hypothetical protein